MRRLPAAADAGRAARRSIAELRRCVDELGFVGLQPQPRPVRRPLDRAAADRPHWYPFYEKMVELDVPAMVHVSASCNPNFHATGAHYINADTTAFMQFIQGDLFKRLPDLRFVIPHGGGAVPYHWGRYRGLADMLKQPPLGDTSMGNVFFDTCVYHQPASTCCFEVIDIDNILFGSEMVGAVRGIDPETGHYFDDTRRYIEAALERGLDDEARTAVFEGNVRRVYPRLAAALEALGADRGAVRSSRGRPGGRARGRTRRCPRSRCPGPARTPPGTPAPPRPPAPGAPSCRRRRGHGEAVVAAHHHAHTGEPGQVVQLRHQGEPDRVHRALDGVGVGAEPGDAGAAPGAAPPGPGASRRPPTPPPPVARRGRGGPLQVRPDAVPAGAERLLVLPGRRDDGPAGFAVGEHGEADAAGHARSAGMDWSRT